MWWREHCQKGATDERTDRRTDGLNHPYNCLVPAKIIDVFQISQNFVLSCSIYNKSALVAKSTIAKLHQAICNGE